MHIRIINFLILIAVFFISFQCRSFAGGNVTKGENMDVEKISYLQLKVKDKFSKEEIKIEIKNKDEIRTIINSILHYKEKTLIDLICKYQLEVYGSSNELIKLYEVGWFMDNKKMVLVRDKSKDEDYIVVGEAATKIAEYLNKLEPSE